jgi:hypothetical protein
MALATGAPYQRTQFEQGPFGAGSPNVTHREPRRDLWQTAYIFRASTDRRSPRPRKAPN